MAEFLAEETEEVPFDATRVEFHGDSSQTADAWPITIETPAAPWSYAAYLFIPPRARRVRNARLRIRTRNMRGEPWVGVLTRDQKNFLCRSAIPEGRGSRETDFDDIDLSRASMIVVQNGAQTGSSRITIESATLSIPVYSSPPPVASAAGGSKLVQLGPHRFLLRGLSEN